MADGYQVATLDEMAHPKWPYWKTVRHHFDIRAFGINAWCKGDGEDVIPTHDESGSGHEELYLVTQGRATFTVDGNEVDAPAGTAVFIREPSLQRGAVSRAADTTVVSIGGWAGRAFEPSRWELDYVAEDAE